MPVASSKLSKHKSREQKQKKLTKYNRNFLCLFSVADNKNNSKTSKITH